MLGEVSSISNLEARRQARLRHENEKDGVLMWKGETRRVEHNNCIHKAGHVFDFLGGAEEKLKETLEIAGHRTEQCVGF